MNLTPNSYGARLRESHVVRRYTRVREFNDCHSKEDGKFCSSGAAALGGTLPPGLAKIAGQLAKHRAAMEGSAYDPTKRTGSIRWPDEDEMRADPALRQQVKDWEEQQLILGTPVTYANMPAFARDREADPYDDIEVMVFVDTETGKLIKSGLGDRTMVEGADVRAGRRVRPDHDRRRGVG